MRFWKACVPVLKEIGLSRKREKKISVESSIRIKLILSIYNGQNWDQEEKNDQKAT